MEPIGSNYIPISRFPNYIRIQVKWLFFFLQIEHFNCIQTSCVIEIRNLYFEYKTTEKEKQLTLTKTKGKLNSILEFRMGNSIIELNGLIKLIQNGETKEFTHSQKWNQTYKFAA